MTSPHPTHPPNIPAESTEEDHKNNFFVDYNHIQLHSLTGESNDFGEEESSQEELRPLREESDSRSEPDSSQEAYGNDEDRKKRWTTSLTSSTSSEDAFLQEESELSAEVTEEEAEQPEEQEEEEEKEEKGFRNLVDGDREGQRDFEGVRAKVDIWDQRLRGVADGEYEKLQAQNNRNIEGSLQSLLQVHTEENKELQGREVFIGDYVGVRCLHESTLMYLHSENFEWKWTPDETLAPIITIEPILREPPYSISKLETQECQDKPNYQWELKGGKKCYETEIENVAHNLSYFQTKQTHPLATNKTFVLKFVGNNIKECNFEVPELDKNVAINQWSLVCINEDTEEFTIRPQTPYYLSTIIGHKFYYLSKESASTLTKYKEDAEEVHFYITQKETNEMDQVRHRVTRMDCYCLFDHENKHLNLVHYYMKNWLAQNTPKGILMTRYTSLSNIPVQNYFKIRHYPHQRKIVFETIVNYSSLLNKKPMAKYLAYENGALTLVDYKYIFELQQIEKGENLYSNQPFMVKVPNKNRYLCSIPSDYTDNRNLIAKPFDLAHEKRFYFHLRHIQAYGLAQGNITTADMQLWNAFSVLKRIEREGIDNINPNDLPIAYTHVKIPLQSLYIWLEDKESNKLKYNFYSQICLNGYYNQPQMALFYSKSYYQWYFGKLRELRRKLISNKTDLSQISLHPSLLYYPQCEYLLALGSPKRKNDFCSVLKQVKYFTTDPKECGEADNSYKRIMTLQMIVTNCYSDVNMNCKGTESVIYEKECFLPFVQYELSKGEDLCDLSILLGLVSNKYRDAWCIWSFCISNPPLIKYVCEHLKSHIFPIDELEIDSIIRLASDYKEELLENEDWKAEMFFEGRFQADIMLKNQNTHLREIMVMVIYSYGIRCGLINDADFVEKSNIFILESYRHQRISSHILGLLLTLSCNINVPSENSDLPTRDQKDSMNMMISSCLQVLNSFENYDSIEDLFLILEIFECLNCMLQSTDYQNNILHNLKINFGFKPLIKLLNDLSERFLLARPSTFDCTKHTPLYDWKLVRANKAAVDDRAHDVDVVKESYQRDICTKILSMLSQIYKIKDDKDNRNEPVRNIPYISEAFMNSSSTSKEFSNTLLRVIIKWGNFDNEPEVTRHIFNLILKYDGKLEEPFEDIDDDKREKDFGDLCLRTLPFFTHLKAEYKEDVEILQERVKALSQNLPATKDIPPPKPHTKAITSIISLLVRINSLLDFKTTTDKACVKIVNQFIKTTYDFLTKGANYPAIREAIFSFNSYLFTLSWKNRLCNSHHSDLVETILAQSRAERFNLDSVEILTEVLAKLGHTFEWLDQSLIEENDPEIRRLCGFEMNRVRDDSKIVEIQRRIGEGGEENEEGDDREGQRYGIYGLNWTKGSKMMKILIKKFISDQKSQSKTKLFESTRSFQLLLYKLFSNIQVLDPEYDTYYYILQSLEMILEVLSNSKILENSEICHMFYTEHSTDAIFSLIIKKHSFKGESQRVRQMAYKILIKFMEVDISAARKSFRYWTHIGDNKNLFFGRIQRLFAQFSTYFMEEKLSFIVSKYLDETDYNELLCCLQWMTVLCQNNRNWQRYLRKQDNSVKNHNLLLEMIELLRTSALRYHYEYAIDLLRAIIRFMTASVNGKNEKLIGLYVNSNVVRYCKGILVTGLSPREVEFVSKIHKKSNSEVLEEMEKSLENPIPRDCLKKYSLLKQEVLWLLNCLVIYNTEHEIRASENHEVIDNLMVLNYVKFIIYRGQTNDPIIFKTDCKLSEVYNINVGFQSYYLIARLWDNNNQSHSNCVQNTDESGIVKKYLRLLRAISNRILTFRLRYEPPADGEYKKFEGRKNLIAEATTFFDDYSSSIEIVMPNGDLETRYFEILPCFLSFTQNEKDIFWLGANLDDSKTAVISFVEYAQNKIDELFIQQDVQDKWFCPRDVAKKDNWLTDLGSVLIFIMNFILFFALEVNEGETLNKPSLFGLSSSITKIILFTLGIMILIFFAFIIIIQGTIVIRMRSARALRDDNQSKEKSTLSKFFTVFSYIMHHKDKTLQARSIWCIVLCLGFAVAGLASDYFWFSFTIMYLLIFSPHITEVSNAIWNPKKRILSTLVLSAVVVYWFGIIAYVYFGSDFDGAVSGSNITLRRTIAVIFDSWYNFGVGGFLSDRGRSAIMKDVGEEEFQYHLIGSRIGFDFLFFFAVNTLLLNILSGIIIDNFGERRAKSDSIHQRQNDLCFVCGEMSRDLPDFVNHCKYTHNIWDYMYYIGYLKAMDSSSMEDYRDIHVHSCLQQGLNDWFPAYKDQVNINE
ncbi:unnamed protein product [Moneuplotes crassus]|uniref:RyR/IP3R Homology associated domain-containing protein n=2 Tax=Euplotes crassus TaxID=5936 RepID=A0AAD1Y3C6_EUPCR|nr:unnamed protein product [Moneuplotes crassus]